MNTQIADSITIDDLGLKEVISIGSKILVLFSKL